LIPPPSVQTGARRPRAAQLAHLQQQRRRCALGVGRHRCCSSPCPLRCGLGTSTQARRCGRAAAARGLRRADAERTWLRRPARTARTCWPSSAACSRRRRRRISTASSRRVRRRRGARGPPPARCGAALMARAPRAAGGRPPARVRATERVAGASPHALIKHAPARRVCAPPGRAPAKRGRSWRSLTSYLRTGRYVGVCAFARHARVCGRTCTANVRADNATLTLSCARAPAHAA
jgi:hypothetical protein